MTMNHVYGPSKIKIIGSGDLQIVKEHGLRHRGTQKHLLAVIEKGIEPMSGRLLTVDELVVLRDRAARSEGWALTYEMAVDEYETERQRGEVYGRAVRA